MSAIRKTEFPPSQLTQFERPINRQDIDFLKALRSTHPGAFPLVRGCDTQSAIRCARLGYAHFRFGEGDTPLKNATARLTGLGQSFLDWRRQQ